MRADVSVYGAREAADYMKGLAARAADSRTFLETDAADLVMEGVRATFASSPWIPLDTKTVRNKAKAHSDPRILRASDTLFKAVTERGAKGQLLEATDDELRFGADQQGDAHYAYNLQTGKGHFPPRKFLTVSKRTQSRLSRAWLRHIVRGGGRF